mmetsp:Transcript_94356/g.197068  ORF Transcript_94356/g.197068 Transcript_94356/m.197068 type:complete len:264 (+) Transcript_94356:2219-3010(+)
MVADERPIAERSHGVAAGQGVAQPFGHLRLDLGSVFIGDALLFIVVGHEGDSPTELGTFDWNHSVEIHAILGDRASLVEHHGGDLACDGDPARLEAADFVRLLQAVRGCRLPHHHTHRKHRAQAHRDGVQDQKVCRYPGVQVHFGCHVDSKEDDHVKAQNHVHLRQLVIVLEPHRGREQNHSHQLTSCRESSDGRGDEKRFASMWAIGLQAGCACVCQVFLADGSGVGLFHWHLLDGHWLASEHGLVHHEAAIHDQTIARKLG